MFERRRTGKLGAVKILSDVPSGTTTIGPRMEIAPPERDDGPVDQTLTQTIRGSERGFGGLAEGGAVFRI